MEAAEGVAATFELCGLNLELTCSDESLEFRSELSDLTWLSTLLILLLVVLMPMDLDERIDDDPSELPTVSGLFLKGIGVELLPCPFLDLAPLIALLLLLLLIGVADLCFPLLFKGRTAFIPGSRWLGGLSVLILYTLGISLNPTCLGELLDESLDEDNEDVGVGVEEADLAPNDDASSMSINGREETVDSRGEFEEYLMTGEETGGDFLDLVDENDEEVTGTNAGITGRDKLWLLLLLFATKAGGLSGSSWLQSTL